MQKIKDRSDVNIPVLQTTNKELEIYISFAA